MSRYVRFRDLLEFAIGGGWGTDQSDGDDVLVAVVRGTDFLTVKHGDNSSLPRRYERESKLKDRKLRPNDLLIEISGGSSAKGQATGRSLLIERAWLDKLNVPAIPASFCRLVRVKTDLIDPRYAYFALQDMHQSGRAFEYENRSTGISNFQFQHFLDTEKVYLPSLREQGAIAELLLHQDAKIALCKRINESLERTAEAIFRNWFIDQAHDWGTENWQTQSLDSVANFLNGLALQKYPAGEDEDSLPVIKIAQLRAGHTKGADRAGTNVPAPYVVNDGDLLFSWSGSLEVDFWCGGRGALNQHLFKVSTTTVPLWYAYLWTKHHLPEFRAIAANKATTMGHIQRKHLTSAEVLLPPQSVLSAMDAAMSPIISQMIQQKLQARALVELRDELLPKLLSGELAPVDEATSV